MTLSIKQGSSLYVRTSFTILIALFIFMVFASAVVFQYLMQPIAKKAAGDLAALMVLSSQTWVELSPDARPRFETELQNYHDLLITSEDTKHSPLSHDRPFIHFLKQALEERLEQPVKLYDDTTKDLVWVEIEISRHLIHIGTLAHPVGANPPRVIFLLLLGAAVLIFFTSSFLVRRLTQPLEKLSRAVIQMGRGTQVAPLEETGATELILLTRSFNQMNSRVQQLLDNRNTLLAGISHDLRTPISRIHLALELMDGKGDVELMDSVRHDLFEIDQLIGQTLELAISNEKALDNLEMVDLNALISSEVEKYQDESKRIEWQPASSAETDINTDFNILISHTAFQRIFQNLLENAIRYGDGLPVKISLTHERGHIKVCIADQGPGIPRQYQSEIFQPFFRLETSRNSNTGGSGLGLAIVSQLCEIYGWSIELVESELGGGELKEGGLKLNAKKGSTFCLTLGHKSD